MPEHIALVNQRLRGAQVKEAIALRMRRAQAVVDYMSDLLTYDDGHPHLLEVPDTDNLGSWDKHTRKKQALERQTTLGTTFGGNRGGGNIFTAV
jgi:hypothetical protein